MRRENTHSPTDQSSSNRLRPRRAAATETWPRVAPPAVGTGVSIDPETSITASIRAGMVTTTQVARARATTAVSGLVATVRMGAPGTDGNLARLPDPSA